MSLLLRARTLAAALGLVVLGHDIPARVAERGELLAHFLGEPKSHAQRRLAAGARGRTPAHPIVVVVKGGALARVPGLAQQVVHGIGPTTMRSLRITKIW